MLSSSSVLVNSFLQCYDSPMRKNPLLPIPPRIRAAHHSDVRVGVHTTRDMDRSTWYAVSAAATHDPDDEPNIGIILELNTSGLIPVPDYDAVVLQESIGGVAEQELFEEEEAQAALQEEDGETLVDVAQNIVETSEFYWDEQVGNWNDALRMFIRGEGVEDVLIAFGEMCLSPLVICRSRALSRQLRWQKTRDVSRLKSTWTQSISVGIFSRLALID